MNRLVSWIVLGVLLTCAVTSADAQSTAGAQVLLITPGARADGMGRAFVAVADDATATWWNPAALGLHGRRFAVMDTQLVPGLRSAVFYDFASYVHDVPGWGGIGINVMHLTYGISQGRDEFGNLTRAFESHEDAVTLAAGSTITPRLSIGAAVKLVSVVLAPAAVTLNNRDAKDHTFAFDLGLLYQVPLAESRFSFGAALQNLGPGISYVKDGPTDPLGRNLKVGGAFEFVSRDASLILSGDVNQPLVYTRPLEKPILNAGAEATFGRLVAVRGGYIYDHEGTIEDFTWGWGIGQRGFTFDYAKVPQSKHVSEHVEKFSLNASPGEPGVDFTLRAGYVTPLSPDSFHGASDHGWSFSASGDIPFDELSRRTRIGSTFEVARMDAASALATDRSLTLASGTLDLRVAALSNTHVRLDLIGGFGGYHFRIVDDRAGLRSGETAFGVKIGSGFSVGNPQGVSFTAEYAYHSAFTEIEQTTYSVLSAGLRF